MQPMQNKEREEPTVVSRRLVENKPGRPNRQIEIEQPLFQRRQRSHFVMRIVNKPQKEYKKRLSLCGGGGGATSGKGWTWSVGSVCLVHTATHRCRLTLPVRAHGGTHVLHLPGG